MKNLILAVLCFGVCASTSFAMALFDLKGTVARVENGKAVFNTATGEKKIRLKRLSKTDQKTVNEAIATKKEVTIKVPPEYLKE